MTFTAAAEHSGVRLDAALAARGAADSRAAAQRMLAARRVTVDGTVAKKSHQLVPGEVVEVHPDRSTPAEVAAAEAVDYEIVREDGHLLVVDKPAGVVVHPGAGRPVGTLVQALGTRVGGGPEPHRPGVVHRLDRDTSGLLVMAKDDPTHSALSAMLKRRTVDRRYLALVEGRPDAIAGTIDAPLGRDRRNRVIHSTDTERPREAVTRFSVLEAFAGATLLEVRLETGRTHQIRAHMAAIGHPVVGDARYGGARSGRRFGLSRQFLHSAQLKFMHPVTREEWVCESKPPDELRRAIDAARRDSASEGPDGS